MDFFRVLQGVGLFLGFRVWTFLRFRAGCPHGREGFPMEGKGSPWKERVAVCKEGSSVGEAPACKGSPRRCDRCFFFFLFFQ